MSGYEIRDQTYAPFVTSWIVHVEMKTRRNQTGTTNAWMKQIAEGQDVVASRAPFLPYFFFFFIYIVTKTLI